MSKTKVFIERANKIIDVVEKTVLSVFLLMMIGLACLQIALRNLFQGGIADADPLLRLMVLWVGLLGAIAASRSHHHITIDVFSKFLTARTKSMFNAFSSFFVFLVCGVTAWHATKFIMIEFEAQTIAFGSFQAWAVELILPIAFGLIALCYLITSIENLLSFVRK